MIILLGLTLAALLLVVALVVDHSLVRQDRQENKSAADFAAAAGIRSLDDGHGAVQPWKGVCAAIAYARENAGGALDGMTGTYANGDESSTYSSSPCDAPTEVPYTTLCTSSPSTWASFVGEVDEGRIRVTVKSGYLLPDPAFPEDSNASYAGDTGDPALGGCDQLAVILEELQPAQFGGIAGSSGTTSRVRSVARLDVGTLGESTAALLLLERSACRVLTVEGTSGARVEIGGQGDSPGVIHADSLAHGAGCDPTSPQEGNVFQVQGNPPDPRIVVRRAETPAGSETSGILSSYALSGAPGAGPDDVSSPWPGEVCVQVAATDCGPSLPITGQGPTPGVLIGRGVVDQRYRVPLIALRNEAQERFGWTSATLPVGWTEVACGAAGPFTATRIWVNCAGGVFNGNGKTFTASVDEVVVNGRVAVEGNGNTLRFDDPTKLYILGSTTEAAVALNGTNNSIRVNENATGDGDGDGFVCDDRAVADPSAQTKVVIGNGPVLAEGGSGKVLRLCQSTVLMIDDSGAPGCPLPSSDGVAPYDNGCRGRIRVAGANRLDWSAPNRNLVTSPTRAQLDELEDLAFWTETQAPGPCSSGQCSTIEGNGGVRLSGIFFTPNADPFRVGGGGTYDIENAQFITRRLEVAGNGTLLMRPEPQDAIQIPVLGGYTLVR